MIGQISFSNNPGKGTFLLARAQVRPETNLFGIEYAKPYAAYSADRVRRASVLAMHAGADFIKTSTGKIQPAATLPVTLVLSHCTCRILRPASR